MTASEKIKSIDNKVEQNKAQYNLDRQTGKIATSSLGNVGKYQFVTGEDILLEKDLPEKAATIKIFEYSLLGKELKAQTNIAKYQCKLLKDRKVDVIDDNQENNNNEKNIRVVKVIL